MNIDEGKISIDIDVEELYGEFGEYIARLKILQTFFNFLYIFPDAAIEINDAKGNIHLIAYLKHKIPKEGNILIRTWLGDDQFRVMFAEMYRARHYDVLFLAKSARKVKKHKFSTYRPISQREAFQKILNL